MYQVLHRNHDFLFDGAKSCSLVKLELNLSYQKRRNTHLELHGRMIEINITRMVLLSEAAPIQGGQPQFEVKVV